MILFMFFLPNHVNAFDINSLKTELRGVKDKTVMLYNENKSIIPKLKQYSITNIKKQDIIPDSNFMDSLNFDGTSSKFDILYPTKNILKKIPKFGNSFQMIETQPLSTGFSSGVPKIPSEIESMVPDQLKNKINQLKLNLSN